MSDDFGPAFTSDPTDSELGRALIASVAAHESAKLAARDALAEAAGLVVIDPADEGLVERVAREIARQNGPDGTDDYVARFWPQFKPRAEKMIAALTGEGPR